MESLAELGKTSTIELRGSGLPLARDDYSKENFFVCYSVSAMLSCTGRNGHVARTVDCGFVWCQLLAGRVPAV